MIRGLFLIPDQGTPSPQYHRIGYIVLFKEDKSQQEIIELICAKYDVEKIYWRRIWMIFSQLRDYNLLEE